ncbi:DEAD-domain-containing protein [Fistulina hepatica ATCC 64428]|uniref:ATP-dependent RNA helicase n=1 Tax=Fistulina hepatica ATCC 64428 TaxID=1128425 RepID=A0A0D7AF33_9AGAR|nr:DEAD-domain-containing protein [Fistulina hepatica ATCC 64428]
MHVPKAGPSRPNGKKAKTMHSTKTKRSLIKQKIEDLDKRAMEFVIPDEGIEAFDDLPISELTKRGLKKAAFVETTDIQAKSLPVSLKGKDVLGAARTGSGKTLAFLIPILEILYRRKWGPTDGLGALVISPTRELAVQIFDVLRSIGGYHSFSAGLVIGGKSLKDESDRLSRMNILIATPGRLLQHMDQTYGFDTGNLQMLVLDEADRILDMGFKRTLSALLSHLPGSRQTLLFSATQTSSVSDLARLSLRDPVSIGVGAAADPSTATPTPQSLEQHYVVCPLEQKLDTLWSFIKTHLQCKALVFLSSCKQVRFVFETFCRMHPGVPLLHLHGKQKQSARLQMYERFASMSHAILLATDIAARGLDFPAVDWVLQVDAPEDTDTYIHRVGRTARYERKGKGLLFLMPSEEEGMKAALAKKGINVNKIKIRPSKTQNIVFQLQKLAFQDPEIKYLGQRVMLMCLQAFVSYLRSVHLHKDKSVFKLDELPIDKFAESLGLPGAPKIKFLSRELAKQKKNASRFTQATVEEASKEVRNSEGESSDADDIPSSSDEEEKPDKRKVSYNPTDTVRTKYDRMFERKNQTILSEHYSKLIDRDDDNVGGENDFFTLKRADHKLDDDDDDDDQAGDGDAKVEFETVRESNLSKKKKKTSKTQTAILENGLGQRLLFDDEGKTHEVYELGDADEWVRGKGGMSGVMEEGRKFAESERGRMYHADVIDKEEAREKKREKKRKRKQREQEEAGVDGGGVGSTLVAELGAPLEDDGYMSPEFHLSDDDDDEEAPPAKRSKMQSQPQRAVVHERALEDDEVLALQLLRDGHR